MCPTMQEDYIEQANAVDGAFNGQPQRKYDPFSNTYNSGLRDHLNLRYGNLPQQGNQGWQFHPHGFQPRLLNSRVESLKTSKMGKIRLKLGEISKIGWNHKFRTVFTISTKKTYTGFQSSTSALATTTTQYTPHTTFTLIVFSQSLFFPVVNTSTTFSSVFTLHQQCFPFFFPIINNILFSLH